MRRMLTAAAVITLMSASGCGSDEPTAATASPATAATSAVAVPKDVQGAVACKLVGLATKDDTLMESGTVETITGTAAESTTESIRFAAQMLADRDELAQAAQGAGDEFARKTDLVTAAVDFKTACITAGLDPE